jgi:hypothetical protein
LSGTAEKLAAGAKQAAEKGLYLGEKPEMHTSGPKQLAGKSDFEARMTKSIPQWLKPPVILFALHRG